MHNWAGSAFGLYCLRSLGPHQNVRKESERMMPSWTNQMAENLLGRLSALPALLILNLPGDLDIFRPFLCGNVEWDVEWSNLWEIEWFAGEQICLIFTDV